MCLPIVSTHEVTQFTGCLPATLRAHNSNTGGGGDVSVVVLCVSWRVYTYNTEMTQEDMAARLSKNVADIYSSAKTLVCKHNGQYQGQQNDLGCVHISHEKSIISFLIFSKFVFAWILQTVYDYD